MITQTILENIYMMIGSGLLLGIVLGLFLGFMINSMMLSSQ